MVQRKLCTLYTSPKPPGCPEDTSWSAFVAAGWQLRFLGNYSAALEGVNPNVFGMVESIGNVLLLFLVLYSHLYIVIIAI